ncbi:MAG: tetratricopeptide repeat protein [Bacteroidetes bacterium]|nr:tetratricopeptide repeat protein [Bacteroidota bacterium]
MKRLTLILLFLPLLSVGQEMPTQKEGIDSIIRILINDTTISSTDRIDRFTMILDDDTTLHLIYYFRAMDYEHSNQLQMAMKDYDKAILLFPSFSSAYYGRGLLKISMGDTLQGCKDLHKNYNLGTRGTQSIINKSCEKCCGSVD